MVDLARLKREMKKYGDAESARPVSESVLAKIILDLISAIEDLQLQIKQLQTPPSVGLY